MPPVKDYIIDLTKDDGSDEELPRLNNPTRRSTVAEPIEISDSESDSSSPQPLVSQPKLKILPARSETRKRGGGHIGREARASKRVSTRPGSSDGEASTQSNLQFKTSPVTAQRLPASKFAPPAKFINPQTKGLSKDSATQSEGSIPFQSSGRIIKAKSSRELNLQNEFPNLPGINNFTIPNRQKAPRREVRPSREVTQRLSTVSSKVSEAGISQDERTSSSSLSFGLYKVKSSGKRRARSNGRDDPAIERLLMLEDLRGSQDLSSKDIDPPTNEGTGVPNSSSDSREATPSSELPSASQPKANANTITSKSLRSKDNIHITTAEIQELLLEFVQELRDNHSATVDILLRSARTHIQSVTRSYDEVSPFAAMKSVEIDPDDRKSSKKASIAVDTFTPNGGAKYHKTRTRILTKSFKSEVKRVPRYGDVTMVRRNILTPDGEKLRFIPFLENDEDPVGRNGQRLQKELQSAYKTADNESSRDKEDRNLLFSNLDWWLEELPMPCTRRILEQYLIKEDTALGKSFRDGLLKGLGGTLPPALHKMASRFSDAWQIVHRISLREVILSNERILELSELIRKPNRKSLDANATTSPLAHLETYITLTCQICSAVDCQSHGEYTWERAPEFGDEGQKLQSENMNYLTAPQRLTMQPAELLRKYNERVAVEEEESSYNDNVPKKCSPECRHSSRSRPSDSPDFSPPQLENIHLMTITIRNRQRRSCTIAEALSLPCWKVHAEIEKFESEGGLDLHLDQSPVSHARAKRPEWYDSRKKTLKGDWQKVTSAHAHEEMSQANPCTHSGPCSTSCPCVEANILCESFCSCPKDCPRRFTGCSCLQLTGLCCNSENCICIQLNRECGPLCNSCGAVERINPAVRYDDTLFETGCQNVSIQRNVSKRLIIGESEIAGFGCYTAEAIRKGSFVSEYKGEIISNLEADRRGIVYDRKYLSFLFDLNSEWVIDAARFGNKTRYFNHAATTADGLNIEAKIYWVNGEHRIKFVALRDIEPGEELLFNYGKKFAEKHGLDKKLPKVRESTKKGVVTGEEALDLLDGVDKRRKDQRGVFAESGTGTGMARKQQKARKSAPNLGGSDEEAEEERIRLELEEAEDDEEDYEEGGPPRKSTRRRMRPLKYSR
ncbi:SET [Glarea lozoyensis ATCC 20868]|uniref:SET n=1 Tax=Glarea lozoyensis (strain ATCC 20868 / MF5171) TaxID=1116229 RepID=S3D894_GLAL2|nr:SET [Glarea lozoyensis ATCC 20868]EPE33980.1 SET [Glarea lozoyensis ATCC 20868]